jgi:hypothetical protein
MELLGRPEEYLLYASKPATVVLRVTAPKARVTAFDDHHCIRDTHNSTDWHKSTPLDIMSSGHDVGGRQAGPPPCFGNRNTILMKNLHDMQRGTASFHIALAMQKAHFLKAQTARLPNSSELVRFIEPTTSIV